MILIIFLSDIYENDLMSMNDLEVHLHVYMFSQTEPVLRAFWFSIYKCV